MKNILFIFMIIIQQGCADNSYYYKHGQKTTLTPISTIERSVENIDYYENEDGVSLGVTQNILVKFKDDQDIEQILSDFNLTTKNNFGNNLYLLETTNRNVTISISNELSQNESILYAHPDFIKKRIKR